MRAAVIKGVSPFSRATLGSAPIPEGVNWDLYLGPAPYRAFTMNRFHYGWHFFWDTSTAGVGNNGVHSLDVVRWGLNKSVHPVRILCTGNGIRLTAKQHSFKGSRGIPAQRAGFSRFRLWLQLWLPCQTSICWRVSGRGAGRSGSGAVAGGTRRCRRGSVRRSCPAWRRAPRTALPSAAPRCAGCS